MNHSKVSQNYNLNYQFKYIELAIISIFVISLCLIIPSAFNVLLLKISLIQFIVITISIAYFISSILYLRSGQKNIIKVSLNLISFIFGFAFIANILTNSTQLIENKYVLFNYLQIMSIFLAGFFFIYRSFSVTALHDLEDSAIKRTKSNLKALDKIDSTSQEITQVNKNISKLRDTQIKIKSLSKGGQLQIYDDETNKFKKKNLFSLIDEIDEENQNS